MMDNIYLSDTIWVSAMANIPMICT